MTDLDVEIRSLIDGAAEPVEFDEVVRRDRADVIARPPRRVRTARPFALGFALVGVVALIVAVAVVRGDDSSPSATDSIPDRLRSEEAIASGETDGVSWTVFRGQDEGGLCYRYTTTPPIEPSRQIDGVRPDFPGLCTSAPTVSPAGLATNALFVGIAPLPSGGTLVYGLVRGGATTLNLTYSDGTNTTYTVTDDSIVLGVPNGKTLDKINVAYGDLKVECTPMILGSPTPADSRTPDSEFGCSPLMYDGPIVTNTGPSQ